MGSPRECTRILGLEHFRVERIEWDGGLGVSLIIEDGRQVVFGSSGDLDRKMATLRFILNQKTGFKYLDLRPSAPYYR